MHIYVLMVFEDRREASARCAPRISEIPTPLSSSLGMTPLRHHLPALPSILSEEIISTFAPLYFAFSYTISRCGIELQSLPHRVYLKLLPLTHKKCLK